MTTQVSMIDDIYEAALVPDKWVSVLEGLSNIAGTSGGILISARNQVANPAIVTERVREVYRRATEGGWWTRNVRGQQLLALPAQEFHSDADHFTPEEMRSEPLYRDLIWPSGFCYAAATHIPVPNGDSLILSLEMPFGQPPVSRVALDRLTGLRPHIARSALLAARLSFERIRSANEAFGLTGLPSAAIDVNGRVLDCNSLFLLSSGQTDIGSRNRLRLLSDDANSVLDQCLSAARSAAESNGGPPSRSIALPRSEGNEAAVMHLVPVKGYARDLFSSAAFFVILTPLDGARLAPVELIQSLFDLTMMEARVARALAGGKDVGAAAQDFGISRETVRHHLKNIFSKTGYSRQTDLATAISLVRTID